MEKQTLLDKAARASHNFLTSRRDCSFVLGNTVNDSATGGYNQYSMAVLLLYTIEDSLASIIEKSVVPELKEKSLPKSDGHQWYSHDKSSQVTPAYAPDRA